MSHLRQDQLSRVVIKGYKSIKECDIELKNINVLIGSNGAGKSNFVSAFELLRKILSHELQLHVAKKGLNSLFYNGLKVTDSIEVEFHIGKMNYTFELQANAANRIFFRNEAVNHGSTSLSVDDAEVLRTKGLLIPSAESQFVNAVPALKRLYDFRYYHFHDTGITSKIKAEHNISNSKNLQWDASNLAAFLYRLREHHAVSYKNILFNIKLVAPYFNDFELEPMEYNKELITLRWLQNGCEDIFNASQLSDGTLRFICLAALLLQPLELQPSTIIIDEPEIGLHPFAITILAEMVQKVAANKQVILSTQSVELLNHFGPEDVVVVDRDSDGSKFKRICPISLKEWLEDYTLGELWNKNILGGRFAR